ncbi:MAG: hypothetical protein NTY60_01710 [Proteobacteria bacterium]|nr:hypothetical protein [Pseudomonadota bacterium]
MKNYNNRTIVRLSALFLLACTFGAQATAPRITAQLFGEERKADIVAYQSAMPEAQSDSALAVQIVTEAFKAAGKTPVVDVLPSKQLATYALFNNDAVALIGSPQDLAVKDKKQYNVVTFYLGAAGDVVLIFAHGTGLHKAFVAGMQKIIKSGKYLEIIEKSRGKLPADYVKRIKRLNPGWK